jgi:hypothetical protein
VWQEGLTVGRRSLRVSTTEDEMVRTAGRHPRTNASPDSGSPSPPPDPHIARMVLCARCNKPAYHVEQVVGPAGKVYHKACLKCLSCGKRLDSHLLVEHDDEVRPFARLAGQFARMDHAD